MRIDTTEDEKTAKAALILACLGDGWTADHIDGHYTRHLIHADGYGVSMRWDDTRIEISGIWPRDKAGCVQIPRDEYRPGITVAYDKAPTKIAADIVKRFLPGYVEVWKLQKEKADSNDRYEATTAANVARIVAASNGHARTSANSKHGVYFMRSHLYSTTVQGDSVRIEAFNMPIDQFLAILPHMADHSGPARDE